MFSFQKSAYWGFKEYNDWIQCGCPTNSIVISIVIYDNIITMPTMIERLENLESLVISSSSIISYPHLPAEIGKLTKLSKIHISNTNITSIPPEIGNLSNLRELYIANNKLTTLPVELGNLCKLESLVLTNNSLLSLPLEIGNLCILDTLILDKNHMTSIPMGIFNMPNLEILWISDNHITSIPPEIGNLSNLRQLYIARNEIVSIAGEIGNLHNLSELFLTGNRLTTLPPELGDLRNLSHLYVSENRLTSLPPELGNLRNLTLFVCRGNEIENVPRNVRRLIESQRDAQGIYGDTQSVHNSTIQKTLKESIMRLLNERETITDVIPLILSDSILTPLTKASLVEYSNDKSVHTCLNLTFYDLLVVVWNRIAVSPHSDDIKAVLNTEMQDAQCMCFTGRISRLVNCLNGFDSLVTIQISDNEQIGTIILLVKTQLEDANEYTTERHKEVVRTRLEELGIAGEEIEKWLVYIE